MFSFFFGLISFLKYLFNNVIFKGIEEYMLNENLNDFDFVIDESSNKVTSAI